MKNIVSSTMNFLFHGVKVAAVTFFTFNYVGGFVICYGPSMEPTLKTRDILLTEHISPRLKRIDIGDVVVARSPEDYRCVCKRVVAGPGDVVIYKSNPITIPKEYVWLEGDNKGNSNDSRFYGPVPYSMVRRRCFCKVWPDLDLDLEASERYYLQSTPTEQQRAEHILQRRKKDDAKSDEQISIHSSGETITISGGDSSGNNTSSTTTPPTSLLPIVKNCGVEKCVDVV